MVRNGVAWKLGYADDLVLTAELEQEVLERFDRRRTELELRWLKVNWIAESRESKSKCSMERMEGYGKFANRQKNAAEDTRKCL